MLEFILMFQSPKSGKFESNRVELTDIDVNIGEVSIP